MTVLKPLGVRLFASARKFPAAPFTSMSTLPNCDIAYSTTAYPDDGRKR